jgi:hypothetical protein
LLTLLYHILNPLVGFITPQPNAAGGRPCRVANSKPNYQRSRFVPVHGKAQLSTIFHQPIDCGEIGSTLSPEERQLLERD